MTLKITDPVALAKMTLLEGDDWAQYQEQNRDADYTFFRALHVNQTDDHAISVIYGSGGWARYKVLSNGDIVLDGSSTYNEKVVKARELGFCATNAIDLSNLEREMSALRAKRAADFRSLCLALARDVLTFAGHAEPPPEDPQMTSLMTARITGWLSARLGLMEAGLVAAIVELQMQQCRERKSTQVPADVSLRGLLDYMANKGL